MKTHIPDHAFHKNNKVYLIFEPVALLAVFLLVVHLLTAAGADRWRIAVALFIVTGMAITAFVPVLRPVYADRRLLRLITALATGFWVFNCFRYYGLVAWPLARPGNLYGYLLLLYFHFILAANVLIPVLIMNRVNGQGNPIRWGAWGRFSVTKPLSVVLVATSTAAVLISIGFVTTIQIQPLGPFWGIVVIAVMKASLTGGTEELCYRGILQPVCVARYGPIPGIVFQALLYTVFHMHLGPVVLSGAGYLGCVLALGLIFGAVTQMTAGIGWALIIHVSINIVVEWLNISSI